MSAEEPRARGIATRSVEIAAAAGIMGLGVLVVFDSLRLGARWADDGPQAGCFSFYVGAILCVCGLALLAHGFLGRFEGAKTFVTGVELRRILQVFVPAAVYVAAIQLVGIYVASACYIAVCMRWLGRYPLPIAAALGAGLMTAFFLMFELWFNVPLYKGLWNPKFFPGY